MRIVRQFERAVREVENVFIPLRDGCKLAARIWLPADAGASPVPAILEYLPYRKRDRTADRDALTHPYFAGHGYAGVRVDMRGSGDSDGVLQGEYLEQEQNDALEVIEWLVRQVWCTGRVGMIGISWGGFNALQIAARRPPALRAIVSICSTDDRYADDIHFMGGCLLLDKITWGSTMFSLNSSPPDPVIVGERWRPMWMQRLQESGLWIDDWLEHQRRDAFYKHGSVCEDWSAIQCPVYAVGGWADGYSNAILRLLANLKVPRKGLIGPWAHRYPHFAKPGPQIGFLQECLRWFDHWLKERKTGVMEEPMLRVFLEEPARPQAYYEEKAGRWVVEESWPPHGIERQRWPLLVGRIGEPGEIAPQVDRLSLASPQVIGLAAGKWCPYGVVPDQPIDQRMEAGGSLLFDTSPLAQSFEILGAAVVELEVASNRPNALLAATLCEVFPDGAATRVSYALLNLAHRDSHEHPIALEPGRDYKIRLQLKDIAHRFEQGNRIRIALSTCYWPTVWPSPQPVTLTISTGIGSLILPVRAARPENCGLRPFPEAEHAEPVRQTYSVPSESAWTTTYNRFNDETTIRRLSSDGVRTFDDNGLEVAHWREDVYRIKSEDPLSARLDSHAKRSYRRGTWNVGSETRVALTATHDHFLLSATLDAFENGNRVFTKSWSRRISRDHV
jgi:uncharacterized protein